jgi:hypothetical protein
MGPGGVAGAAVSGDEVARELEGDLLIWPGTGPDRNGELDGLEIEEKPRQGM